MGRRRRPSRSSLVLLMIGGLVGSVLLVGAGSAGAATSASDCQAVLAGMSDVDQGSGAADRTRLADKGDNLEAVADDVSNKKLKKAFRRIAAVWVAASEAKNDRAATLVIAERTGDWAKGFKVISKALRKCSSQSAP